MALKWESNDFYLQLLNEVEHLGSKLTKTEFLNETFKDLNDLKLNFENSNEMYTTYLLRSDNYLETLYGAYINAFQTKLHPFKKDYETWYNNQLLNIDEQEKRGRWQSYAKNAHLILQREFRWDQKRVIKALESRYVRDKTILKLSENLYFLLMENMTLQNNLLDCIKEDILACAMYGSALNQTTDNYLDFNGFKQTNINSYSYFDFCGYSQTSI